MPNKPLTLVVEDTPSMARLYAEYLRAAQCEVAIVDTGAAARAFLAGRIPDAMVLDLRLPDENGLDLLQHMKGLDLPTEIVVVTAHGSLNIAVDAMRAGAFDFIVKPFSAERLNITVRNALERRKLRETVEIYREEFDRPRYCGFIGSSLAMQAVYRVIESAAQSKATVFITGESGTGKELCAEAVHGRSPRHDQRFVALNCAAIPRDLLESELFGYVKGAFTGAVGDREGAALQAHGGTLFLDEICETDPNLQSKLLRFLQTGMVQRVGSNKLEPVDVRIVCASNKDPLHEVSAGRFREDLFYRLHVIPVRLPPLREREDDVILIARDFLARYAKEEGRAFQRFSPEAEAVLRVYDWPGNVRQLQNVVRNVVVLNDGEEVRPEMLPPPLGGPAPATPSSAAVAQLAAIAATAATAVTAAATTAAAGSGPATIRPLWQVERDAIEEAIRLCGGNIPRAAALLEISPSTIYRKRQAWEAAAEPLASPPPVREPV